MLTREAGGGIKPRVSPRTRGDGRKGIARTREAGDGACVQPSGTMTPPPPGLVFVRERQTTHSRIHLLLYSATPYGGSRGSSLSPSTGSRTHPWLYSPTPPG